MTGLFLNVCFTSIALCIILIIQKTVPSAASLASHALDRGHDTPSGHAIIPLILLKLGVQQETEGSCVIFCRHICPNLSPKHFLPIV